MFFCDASLPYAYPAIGRQPPGRISMWGLLWWRLILTRSQPEECQLNPLRFSLIAHIAASSDTDISHHDIPHEDARARRLTDRPGKEAGTAGKTEQQRINKIYLAHWLRLFNLLILTTLPPFPVTPVNSASPYKTAIIVPSSFIVWGAHPNLGLFG